MSHAWRALRHRNFKLFFFGQGISVIGYWMTRLATTWLVYRLTHSALLLGIVSFAGQIISFVLGPFAGVWVERLNRRKLLVATQAAAAVQSLAMAALTLAHVITLWEVIALTALQGLINAFDMPARRAATLGWRTGASGIGAVLSALSLAIRKSVVGLTRMLQIAVAILGGALILFGLSHTLWLSLVLMVFVGFGLMQGASVSNTIIQSLVTEDKRARVMSYYTMAFFGAVPFGGLLAHQIGVPYTVIVTGAVCVAGSLWFTLDLPKVNAVVRPIYREMGLLPERDTSSPLP